MFKFCDYCGDEFLPKIRAVWMAAGCVCGAWSAESKQ